MERKQFTFYRSFWEAVKRLSKNDRLAILETIIVYALDGEVPKALSPRQEAVFMLIMPILEASRKKALKGSYFGDTSSTFCEELDEIFTRYKQETENKNKN